MSNNSKEVVSGRDLLTASSLMDSRRLPDDNPPLKRGVEGSADDTSDTTSTQIAANCYGSKRIRLETAACSVEKDLSHNRPRSTTSSESQTENSRKSLTSVEGVDYSIADNLLKCGNDVDALRLLSNLDPRAPLCTAVKNKHYPVAELLITFKADVNARDENRKPPLYYAIQNVDVKMTKLLLNNGAKVEHFPELLHLAASKKSIEIVEALLQQGVDVNVRGENGNTVLHCAVSTACKAVLDDKRATETHTTNADSAFNEFAYVFNLLSTFNVKVNLSNDAGSTPLHCSSMNGILEISTFLLNKGANVNAQDNQLSTPLDLAAFKGHADVVKLLLERGAQVNCRNTDGFTPLHWAAFKGHADVVKLLLEWGAQVNLEDSRGFSPLHFAVNKNDRAIIDALLTSGACVNAKTQNGETPLHYAVFHGQEEAVKLLLERGAQVNCRGPDGYTPLDFATSQDKSRIIEILLRFGACVNSRTDKGKTALHIASEAGYPSAVAILLDNGADVSMKCERSYTPFDYAWGFDRAIESRGDYYRNIVINGSHPRHDTIDLLLRHQVKLEVAGLNPTASSEGGLEDFYFECQLEVARMKSFIIASTNVSYFDIVKKDTRLVAKFLKNKSIVLALEFEDYKREFPIYAGIIRFKFREAFSRTKLVERATQVFHRIRGWPEDCTAKVLDFLDDDDLKVFLDV